MARFQFRLPDIGEGIAEAEIVTWHAKPGEELQEDAPMVDMMTDKATVEMTSPVSGRVVALHGEVGQSVPVGSLLVEIELDAEAPAPEQSSEPISSGAPSDAPPGAPPGALPEVAGSTPAVAAASALAQRPLAAPATRHRAEALGIKLDAVTPTGPEGRITTEDLDAYIVQNKAGDEDAAQRPASGSGSVGEKQVKIVGLRRTIARKMQEAKRRIPHFTYVEEFDMTALEALRAELNASRAPDMPKLTLLPFFMRGLVALLPEFPQVNSQYDDEAEILHTFGAIHIGIATQTRGGLMVPVVRHAERRDLWDCARELARVTTAAREEKAKREELTGSTITLTSLGPIGGISATPIINHPEVAIIGPNKLVERPVVLKGQVVVRTMMNLSSSFDHRIVDGHDAARFIQGLKRLIEQPALLFT